MLRVGAGSSSVCAVRGRDWDYLLAVPRGGNLPGNSVAEQPAKGQQAADSAAFQPPARHIAAPGHANPCEPPPHNQPVLHMRAPRAGGPSRSASGMLTSAGAAMLSTAGPKRRSLALKLFDVLRRKRQEVLPATHALLKEKV
jgi:hypothetical protein